MAGWHTAGPLKARAANGDIVPDPQKFPQGMKAFSNGLGKIGVGLGIYTAHGNKTCQAYPGSLGHEAQDVQLYAPGPLPPSFH